ncbi:MAG TPA: FAD-dependent monooxygenase [Myxococcota bacterium]|nr:FAD-dependent monooxygenase [Myxococcota bacterium]
MARVLIVGAGPAGAGLAHLLAERGIEVALLERQLDFAREFRGEFLMPSGIEALEQMGLGPLLETVPHAQPDSLGIYLNRRLSLSLRADEGTIAEIFRGRRPIAVSQPALLESIVREAAKSPGFELLRGATVRDLVAEAGRVVGVRAHTAEGERGLRADLVVGADGRASAVRRRGGFEVREQAPPMDIVWFKVPALGGFRGARGYIGKGHLLIAYHSWDDRLQIAWAILKGRFGELRRRGVAEWVEEMAEHVTPDLAAHLRAHRDALVHPFLLDAVSDRVTRWSAPGMLLLGDAAHTMSPVGGQGLNVALRDAIVAANHLVPALRAGAAPEALDAAARAIEAERLPEIAAIQRAQALPPRLVFSRAWWAEPLRHAIGAALRAGLGARVAFSAGGLFLFGKSPVRLRV